AGEWLQVVGCPHRGRRQRGCRSAKWKPVYGSDPASRSASRDGLRELKPCDGETLPRVAKPEAAEGIREKQVPGFPWEEVGQASSSTSCSPCAALCDATTFSASSLGT